MKNEHIVLGVVVVIISILLIAANTGAGDADCNDIIGNVTIDGNLTVTGSGIFTVNLTAANFIGTFNIDVNNSSVSSLSSKL